MRDRSEKNTKGDGRRIHRVEQEVQKTIAQYLISGLRVRLPGLVTVSRVLMPADLRTAKIYISVLGSEVERKEALELLQEHAYEVQNFIGRELRMRYCPKLTFHQDETTEHLLKIDRILYELDEQKKKSESGTSGDSE